MYRKNIKPGDTVYIGKEGEHNAQLLVYDISQEIALYGPGVAQVLYQRPGESEAYPVAVEQEGNEVHWLVTATDTAIVGSVSAAYFAGSSQDGHHSGFLSCGKVMVDIDHSEQTAHQISTSPSTGSFK